MPKKTLEYFVRRNLKYRPSFFAYIRPQEAALFEKFKKYVRGTTLDFGCGDGFFADTVWERHGIDIGLDVRESRIKTAQDFGTYRKTIIYDGKKIPLKAASVDSIVSNCVFEHIGSIETSLFEMNRILTKKGHLLTSVMCSTWNNNLLGKKLFGGWYRGWFNSVQQHHSLLSKKQWIRMFRDCGFRVVKEEDYLYRKCSRKTELHHFLSLPSLMLYKFTGKWTLGKDPNEITVKKISELIRADKRSPSACFFVLEKI